MNISHLKKQGQYRSFPSTDHRLPQAHFSWRMPISTSGSPAGTSDGSRGEERVFLRASLSNVGPEQKCWHVG